MTTLPAPSSNDPDDKWSLFDTALFFLWVGGAAVGLSLRSSELFISLDGGYMRDLARRQFEWGVPIFTTSIDLYQGVGDLFFSSINFTLLPSFIVASWFGTAAVAKVATYTIALAEYSFSIILFARALSLTKTQAFAAALGLPLLTFPFHGYGAIYGILAVTPQVATAMAAICVLCFSLLQFGRGTVVHDIRYAILFVGVMLWTVHWGVITLALGGPTLALTFFAAMVAARDTRERWAKTGLAIGAAIIFSAPLVYLLGLLLDSAPITAPTELNNDRAVLTYASILFHLRSVGPAGPLLVIAAMAGAALATIDRSRPRLRVFAWTLLTYLVTRLSFWVVTVLFDFWRGPSALYFEIFVYPLYAIFAVFFVVRLVEFLHFDFRSTLFTHWGPSVLVCTAAVAVVLVAGFSRAPPFGFAYPPTPTALTPILQAETSLVPPGPFRGRVANMTGRKFERGITWFDLVQNDGDVEKQFGNEMRLVGLTYFGIPAFFQYSSTMTPAFYAFTTRLLADQRDRQLRSVIVLRRYEPKLLGMLGIRSVVTDAPIAGVTLQSSAHSDSSGLYLYRVPETNVGNYSPTHFHVATSATEILTWLARSDFEPKREMIGDVPRGGDGLVEVRESSVIFDGVSLHITATSDGRSVLLLPLEYSRCLDVRARVGEPRLFRANLLLTGLVFSGRLDAVLRLYTGPFVNPACRLRDLVDLLKLDVRNVPVTVRH